ncbi:DUF418 domain-containing protein [Polaribacter uvawellassae]|uniref:DUF418 domain-containing protein n=1 Tax=Polaribacter uvawellassae TaxID=3133495 RepID=UPI003218EEE0
MNKRIIGIDVARAFAVIGMILVNFKMVLGQQGETWVRNFTSLLEGKAAATFVVLAGIGIAFMTNSAIHQNDLEKIKNVKKRILKRAFFLFVVGLSYILIWPADILHFYGIYMLIALVLIQSSSKKIFYSTLAIIFLYPIILLFFNYETGWNFTTLDYTDFWTLNGFLRNLFLNGFHPVIPWAAFMLIGLWFGKQDLTNNRFVKKAALFSLFIFIVMQLISMLAITVLSDGSITATEELQSILGTNPMPPLPIYMISGSSISVCIISICILISQKFENSFIIKALTKTGQLALTFYVAHVIIGMGLIEVISDTKLGEHSLNFSVVYGLVFSLGCIVFALIWMKYKKSGPLEWIMRKVTG